MAMDLTAFVNSNRDRALQLGDYGTYRTQLSRQIPVLRKRLGRATSKNAKYAPKAPITSTDIGADKDFAKLLILQAERAWAHAMYMKQLHTQNEGGVAFTGQGRSHVLSRLRKAAYIARLLVDALNDQEVSKATDQDVLEAEGYAHAVAGTGHFEKHVNGREPRGLDAEQKKSRWEPCLNDLAVAEVVYTALLRSTKNEVFKEVLGGSIDPMLKYASWQATGARNMALPAVTRKYFPAAEDGVLQLVKKIDPAAMEEAGSDKTTASAEAIPTTITWRSRKADVVDGAIGQALAAVSTAEVRLNSYLGDRSGLTLKDKAAAYDDVIIASQDTADATRRAIDELEKEGVTESDARMQDLRVTNLAVNYEMVAWRVGRNRALIGESDGLELSAEETRPKKRRRTADDQTGKSESAGRRLAKLRQRVHLYEEIIQSLDSVKELRGAVRDSSFTEELDRKRAFFQALKCINIAYSHDLLSNPKNALALLLRAENLVANLGGLGQGVKSSRDAPLKLDISTESVSKLQARVKSLITEHRGLVELHNLNETSNVASKKTAAAVAPLVERLHVYPSGGVDLENLVTYPPTFKPVPVKPIFLDVAWNYIGYPGQPAEHVSGAGTAVNGTQDGDSGADQKPAKKGWFGFGR